jgi:hypothetical protein
MRVAMLPDAPTLRIFLRKVGHTTNLDRQALAKFRSRLAHNRQITHQR